MTTTSRAPRLVQVVITAFGILTLSGLFLWEILVLGFDTPDGPGLLALSALLLLPVLIGAGVVVHESGHLVAGVALGMRVLLVLVKPLAITRQGLRLRLRWAWRFAAPGYVLVMAPDDRALRRRLLSFIAAGPAASLLTGLLLLAVATILNAAPPRPLYDPLRLGLKRSDLPFMPQTHVVSWLNLAATVNLMIGVATLVPGGCSGWLPTDGTQLQSLRRGGAPPYRHHLLLVLSASSNAGVRPRDWDGILLERLLSTCDGSAVDVAAYLNHYYYALDRGDADAAGRRLDRAAALAAAYPPSQRTSILLETAYFEAYHRNRPRAARDAFALAAGGQAEEPTRLRAEAAIRLAEGRYGQAAAAAAAGLALLPRAVDRGGALAEADWLGAILTESRERQR